MDDITLNQQIEFLRMVVFPSFTEHPNDRNARIDWIKEKVQNRYSNIFGSIIDELLILFGHLQTLQAAIDERNSILQQQTNLTLQQQHQLLAYNNPLSSMSTLSASLLQQDNLHQIISSGSMEGNFLVWKNSIRIFRNIKKILIRESYELIYQQIIEQSQLGYQNFLITGVPGIGKSTFSYYFLWKYFTENPDGEILLEFDQNAIYYIQPNKTTTLPRNQCTALICPYLVDLRDKQEPANLGSYTVVFSSPNPSRYKEFMKDYEISRRYIMPTWSYEESKTLNQIRNIPEDQLDERFELVGGVPRLIFFLDYQQLSEMINQTLNKKGFNIANKFFTSGYQMSDDEISYLIIHLHPPEDGYCSISDKYKFASTYIWDLFYEKYKQIIFSQSANYFNAGPGAYRGSFDGFHFEAVCLTAIPLAEQNHVVTSLNNLDETKELSIPPSRKVNFKDNDQTVESDVLYIPTSKNFESGDAFYLSNNELFVLQITIAEKHPVKANGLQKICDFFSKGGISYLTCHLVFVVPKDGKLINKQNITTKEGKIAKQMSNDVVEFYEHQWRLEYIINIPNTPSYEEKTSYNESKSR